MSGASSASSSSSPGRGGASFGPGAAELTWGAESQGDTERFQAHALPEANYRDAEHTAIAGVGAAAPTVEPIAEGSGSSAVNGSTGSSAWKRRLAPHHRSAVQSFFSRSRP